MPNYNSARWHGTGITFGISIEPLLDALAAGFALSDVSKDPRYIDSVVDEAFERADDVFNLNAAAYGATGAISHMFEWGTVGINNKRTNVRMQPTNPNARLWHTFTEGKGLDRTVWYAFKPSFANVPKPTKAETNMSSDVIKKLKDHQFHSKAEVMEEGHEVTISPKRKWLLIPAYKQNRQYMRPSDVKRGYALTKGPIYAYPGYNTLSGSFTAFWTAFWDGEGEEIMQSAVSEMITSDYTPEFSPVRSATTIRPIGTYSVSSEIAKRKKKVQSRVSKKARTRNLNNRGGR